jgi:molybdopterin molybdotransferase
MEIHIQLTTECIAEQLPLPSAALGAWVEFRGVVRGEEDGEIIAALEYEAYQPMAEHEIRRLLTELSANNPCLAAHVIHRLGIVPVGDAAIYVGVAGRHRAEAFTLLAAFMDRLKQDVPIWKRRAVASLAEVGRVTSCAAPPVGQKTSRAAAAHSASEVVTLLRELCQPLATERVTLAEAKGRVLREMVCAQEDQPSFDRSAVDGYAVRWEDAGTSFVIVDELRAGDWKPRRLQPGEAVRIATGGALPCAGLQVVMKEDVSVGQGKVTVLKRSNDRNIRFRGEEAKAGHKLVDEGIVLQPGALGLLASVGCFQPLVTRLPRVLHLATGNEIVPPDQVPERGQIRDSNSTLVQAFLAQWRIIPEQRREAEDVGQIQSVIQSAKPGIDLLLISGGASVGEHDFTRRMLAEAGFTIHVSKTTARPGKPLIVAQRGNTLAFGLPGNPLAHFVCLNLYVRTALEAFTVQSARTAFAHGVLAADLLAEGNTRETFWPARWLLQEGSALLTPLRWSSSGDLTALAMANALIRVTAGMEHFPRGSRVEFVRTERSS